MKQILENLFNKYPHSNRILRYIALGPIQVPGYPWNIPGLTHGISDKAEISIFQGYFGMCLKREWDIQMSYVGC